MKIALLGYGKMGKIIEQTAVQRGHQIVLRVSSSTAAELTQAAISAADVAVEFSSPGIAAVHVKLCITSGVPVVCGTTGWLGELEALQDLARKTPHAALLQSTNFSVGVQLFFALNQRLAQLMSHQHGYTPVITETHHTEKKDAPSGTAITLAGQMIQELPDFRGYTLNNLNLSTSIPVFSIRKNAVPGTHSVRYRSQTDDIEIIHTAHNREGFALGAVLAAEFLADKQGVFSMQDVLGI